MECITLDENLDIVQLSTSIKINIHEIPFIFNIF